MTNFVQINKNAMERKLISIDWLEFYAELRQELKEYRDEKYIVECKEKKTHIYAKEAIVSIIEQTGKGKLLREFAQIHYAPNSKILPAKAAHIKIYNEQLYTKDWQRKIAEMCEKLKIDYKNLTRLDVACDFNMINGEDPQSFLQKCSSYYYQRLNSRHFRVEHGSTKIGKKIIVDEEIYDVEAPEIESITWGSITSGRQLCIYNKTKELKAKNSSRGYGKIGKKQD